MFRSLSSLAVPLFIGLLAGWLLSAFEFETDDIVRVLVSFVIICLIFSVCIWAAYKSLNLDRVSRKAVRMSWLILTRPRSLRTWEVRRWLVANGPDLVRIVLAYLGFLTTGGFAIALLAGTGTVAGLALQEGQIAKLSQQSEILQRQNLIQELQARHSMRARLLEISAKTDNAKRVIDRLGQEDGLTFHKMISIALNHGPRLAIRDYGLLVCKDGKCADSNYAISVYKAVVVSLLASWKDRHNGVLPSEALRLAVLYNDACDMGPYLQHQALSLVEKAAPLFATAMWKNDAEFKELLLGYGGAPKDEGGESVSRQTAAVGQDILALQRMLIELRARCVYAIERMDTENKEITDLLKRL